MPFCSLTEPAVLKTFTHLEADDLMAKLHKVIENREIRLLKFAIEEMTLDDMRGVKPQILLSL